MVDGGGTPAESLSDPAVFPEPDFAAGRNTQCIPARLHLRWSDGHFLDSTSADSRGRA